MMQKLILILLMFSVLGLTSRGDAQPDNRTFGRDGGMMFEFSEQLLKKRLETRRQRLEAVGTSAEAEAYIRDVRRKIAASFGPLPERTSLNARITGTLEMDVLMVDQVLFDGRPGFLVTGLFYRRKDISGAMPGILVLCGHSGTGKGEEGYQELAQSLALRGYAVLIIDPVSQGERGQLGAKVTASVEEHNLRGNQLLLGGDFLGNWRLFDAMRGLDYLLSRPEVDPKRVGVTGTSGGGTLTTYLNAMDSRLTMAAPSCCVTSWRYNFANELPADAEQNPPGLLLEECDIADFLIAAAPRPTLILAQNNDFFDPRGAMESFEDVRKIYKLLGAEEKISLHIGSGDHGYAPNHRVAAGRWFDRQSGLTHDFDESPDIRVLPLEKTFAAPDGWVGNIPGSRTLRDIFIEKLTAIPAYPERTAEELGALIRPFLQLPPLTVPDYDVLRTTVTDLDKMYFLNRFQLHTEPGIRVVMKNFARQGKYALTATEEATLFIPHLDSEPEVVAMGIEPDEKRSFFSLEVRGIGESRPAETAPYEKRFFAPYGSDFFLASCGVMLGRSYLGGKVHDILASLELLRAKGVKKVHLIGNGQGCVPVALAALLAPKMVTRVTLHHAPGSWRMMAEGETTDWPLSVMLPGILKVTDLPEIYRRLPDLSMIAPVGAQMFCREQPQRK